MKCLLPLAVGLLVVAGCASSNIESRRHERWMGYTSLSTEHRALVDAGQIRVGMNEDAVYIAWGQPAEILQREDAEGMRTIWRYHGAWAAETRNWSYRESRDRYGQRYIERYLERDYDPRSYVRAEIVFAKGQVASWQTMPKPVN